MNTEKKPESPLSGLTEAQQERLKAVAGVLQIDKITISHSIEERSPDGRKMSAFYSVTASRGAGAEITQQGNTNQGEVGFSPDETKLARLVLSKHVVAAVYDDAVKRGILGSAVAQEELRAVLTRYDNSIVKALNVPEDK